MTSLITSMVDTLVTGLQTVTGLTTATVPAERVHKYEPMDPELLQADGNRHFSVHPMPDNFDVLLEEESSFGTHLLEEHYAILVWEGSPVEGGRLVRDEAGWAALLDVWENVLLWLYQSANQILGVSAFDWYDGSDFPVEAGLARWFRVKVRTKQYRQFT